MKLNDLLNNLIEYFRQLSFLKLHKTSIMVAKLHRIIYNIHYIYNIILYTPADIHWYTTINFIRFSH